MIKLSVTDHGQPALSSYCMVEVNLTDINDNSPVLLQREYKRTIKEDVGIGTTVLTVCS